jgi:CHAT domain-containing protein
VQQALLDLKPQIVHFSGHGEGQVSDSEPAGIVAQNPLVNRKFEPIQPDSSSQPNAGLYFETETRQSKLVSTEALVGLFELFSDRVECVVLNACYSELQARAIAQHIPYVIGMNQAIGDRAAIEFSIGFYDALGAGESIEFAYKLGCSMIRMAGISESLTPVLVSKSA